MMRLLAVLTTATLLAPGLAQASEYAPLECSKATSPAGKTICKSYALGQAEARVATLFGVATSLVAMGQPDQHFTQPQYCMKPVTCAR